MNDVSLKQYFDLCLKDQSKAIDLARDGMEKRLEGMNEFREQLNRQAASFVTRQELDAKLESIEKGRRDNIAIGLSLIGIIIALISVIFKI